MDLATRTTDWIVSRLEADPRNPDRVLVSLTPADEWEPGAPVSPLARTLALHIAVVAGQGLRTGLSLEPARLTELQAADEFQRVYNRALDFLAVRPRSEAEVRDRLRRKGLDDADIARVQERLRRAGYLDDAAFARYWLDERARSRPRGPRLLQQELRHKGVPSPIIAQALADFEEARQPAPPAALDNPPNPDAALEEDTPMDEDAADPQYTEALTLARRKHRTYASLDPATYRRRMSAFLLRRGYAYALVSKVLKALAADDDADADS